MIRVQLVMLYHQQCFDGLQMIILALLGNNGNKELELAL